MRTALTKILFATGLIATLPMAAAANSEDCPPSLDGKAVACLPSNDPNLYQIGDVIDKDFTQLENVEEYGLESDRMFYKVGDYVYRVDAEGIVIEIAGTISSES